jgi:hypothetical protein
MVTGSRNLLKRRNELNEQNQIGEGIAHACVLCKVEASVFYSVVQSFGIEVRASHPFVKGAKGWGSRSYGDIAI